MEYFGTHVEQRRKPKDACNQVGDYPGSATKRSEDARPTTLEKAGGNCVDHSRTGDEDDDESGDKEFGIHNHTILELTSDWISP